MTDVPDAAIHYKYSWDMGNPLDYEWSVASPFTSLRQIDWDNNQILDDAITDVTYLP